MFEERGRERKSSMCARVYAQTGQMGHAVAAASHGKDGGALR
ncbi:MAG: hypothetical protein P8Y26_03335 [Gemmatimonadales bacterium]